MVGRDKQVVEAILGVSHRRFLVENHKAGLVISGSVVIAVLLNLILDDVQRMIGEEMQIASNF